ncbi:uncharacterized protein BDV17DRAFT_300290 [Aspergillus undulatus]|uniref:uncharacterized protein n=1 Tax=Aspergillus undulatus TaxID=1810928 RepID=UPI003CCDA9D8
MLSSVLDEGRTKRRRRVYACDSCYKKKIKCDGTLPKCDWCHLRNILCTYTRNQKPSQSSSRRPSQQKPQDHLTSGASTPIEQGGQGVQYLSRLPCPTPGPQPVAPQGFGANICFAGQSLGNIGGFNGLPVFSPGGIEWIKARTGQEVSLDWYQTVLIQASCGIGDGDHPLPLPDIRLLRQMLERYKTSVNYRLFPILNLACFEHTIRAAYGHEVSHISPGSFSAKACIFAFMALSLFFAGDSQGDAIMHTDNYAREVSKTMPNILSESVTLDGLQAILMLCFCCQAVSADILRLELLLSSAARYIFHLKGNIHPKSTEHDPLNAKIHVRNLFWLGFILDKVLSLRTGLQPLFDVLSCDLTLPEGNGIHDYDPTAFHTLIRLSLLKSDIYRGLYSLSALQKSDADLLATIRTLDIALEEWWSSVHRLSNDPNSNFILADFVFEMQYHYSMAAIHQASSRCTAWVLNQDTRAAGSSLAISICAGRSVLNKFLQASPHLFGHQLMLCLPELTLATIHLFSNILMNPLEPRSGQDLNLMRKALTHVWKHMWQQAPVSFTAQVRLIERFMADLQRLAECAIRTAGRS